MKKLIVIALVILAALVGYHFFNASMKGGHMPAGGGAMPVSVAPVEKASVTETSQFSGRFKAVNDAEIRPQVTGTIQKVLFKEGDMVKAGQPLFVLDARTYQAAALNARGGFAQAKAALERGKMLLDEGAISKRDMEDRQATYDSAAAAVASAGVNVDYSTIKAPIGGKVGRIDVTVGNVVAPGVGNALTSIQSISPIYVDFNIDEQTYLTFVKMQKASSATMPEVQVGLATDGNDFPLVGKLQSVDNQIDPTTGSLRARAVMDNQDGSLLPGLFARVRVGTPDPVDVVLVNDVAVGTDQSKRFVYVVGTDNKATYREVHVAGMANGLRIVKDGLQGGEHVVVNGLMRVQPGGVVAPEMVDMRTLTSSTTPAPAATSGTTPASVSATVATSATEAVSGTAKAN